MLGELDQINRKELIEVLPIDILVNEEATSSPALTGILINRTSAHRNAACPNKVLLKVKGK